MVELAEDFEGMTLEARGLLGLHPRSLCTRLLTTSVEAVWLRRGHRLERHLHLTDHRNGRTNQMNDVSFLLKGCFNVGLHQPTKCALENDIHEY